MNDAKILIVEDDLAISNVLSEKFKKEGFSVLSAKNGKDGLDIALENEPNIILLDIVMPVMDGITMLNLLRATKWGKDAKVILLTNLMDAYKMSEALTENVSAYLVKSDWKLEDLVTKVKDLIS